MEIRVESWANYDDVEVRKLPQSCGGMGGWVQERNSWNEYLERIPEGQKKYMEALKDEILEKDLHFTGEQHQHGDGIPIFSDNTQGSFSYRAWGDLMAAIWNSYRCVDQCDRKGYMDYYM